MEVLPVVAVMDAGKTNQKLFLIEEDYQIVLEKSARFSESTDEDRRVSLRKSGEFKTVGFRVAVPGIPEKGICRFHCPGNGHGHPSKLEF